MGTDSADAGTDWSKLSVDQLRSLQVEVSRSLQAKVRSGRPVTAVPEIILEGAHHHRAVLMEIVPASARERLAAQRRGMLAISLGSRNAEGGRLEGCVRWAAKHFDSCLVVVADSIHRLALRATRGLQPGEARAAAIEAGRRFVEQQGPVFQRNAGDCRFEFRMSSGVEKRAEFRAHLAALERLLIENEAFRTSVRSLASLHLGRGLRGAEGEETESRARLSTSYLLEELALFACLAEEGWPLVAYSGPFDMLKEVAEGLHPRVPAPLRELAWLSLSVKRGGAQFMEPVEMAAPTAPVPPPAAERSAEPAYVGPASTEPASTEPGYTEPGSDEAGAAAAAQALLADLSEEGWALLFGYTESLSYSPGEVVVSHGQTDRSLYIVAEGQLEIVQPGGERSAARRLALVAPGSVFGEQSFVDGEPRSASVLAVTSCKVHRLSRKTFEQLMKDEAELASRLLQDIARVLSLRLRSRPR